MAAKDAQAPEAQDSDLAGLLGYNVKRVHLLVQEDLRASLGEDGIPARGFAIMSVVMRHPQITQSALARALGIERSGLVSLVDELERRGFLTRASVPGDKRVQALVPTDAGKAAYARALEAARAHEERLFGGLTEDERQAALRLLQRVWA